MILKFLAEGKNDIGESVQKVVLWNANYDHENNDYTKALRPRRQISYDIAIVPYAKTFYLPDLFPKYYFNKLCFQLPKNITWTDE